MMSLFILKYLNCIGFFVYQDPYVEVVRILEEIEFAERQELGDPEYTLDLDDVTYEVDLKLIRKIERGKTGYVKIG